jgi:NDP-sugar pyrophosphorylase family protein
MPEPADANAAAARYAPTRTCIPSACSTFQPYSRAFRVADNYGFHNFVIALGYKGEAIKRYMVEYASLHSDLTVGLKDGSVIARNGNGHEIDDWTVDLVDTGQDTATGGRIKRLAACVDGTFMLTWGDGVSDIDLHDLLAFHRSHGKLAFSCQTGARKAA